MRSSSSPLKRSLLNHETQPQVRDLEVVAATPVAAVAGQDSRAAVQRGLEQPDRGLGHGVGARRRLHSDRLASVSAGFLLASHELCHPTDSSTHGACPAPGGHVEGGTVDLGCERRGRIWSAHRVAGTPRERHRHLDRAVGTSSRSSFSSEPTEVIIGRGDGACRAQKRFILSPDGSRVSALRLVKGSRSILLGGCAAGSRWRVMNTRRESAATSHHRWA